MKNYFVIFVISIFFNFQIISSSEGSTFSNADECPSHINAHLKKIISLTDIYNDRGVIIDDNVLKTQANTHYFYYDHKTSFGNLLLFLESSLKHRHPVSIHLKNIKPKKLAKILDKSEFVEDLDIIGNINFDHIKLISEAPQLCRLRRLGMGTHIITQSSNGIGTQEVEVLASSKYLTNLEVLWIKNDVQNACIKLNISDTKHLTADEIKKLNLDESIKNDEVVWIKIRDSVLPFINPLNENISPERRKQLINTSYRVTDPKKKTITSAGIKILIASPIMRNVECLNLSGHLIDEEGIQSTLNTIKSKQLPNLNEDHFHYNFFDKFGKMTVNSSGDPTNY